MSLRSLEPQVLSQACQQVILLIYSEFFEPPFLHFKKHFPGTYCAPGPWETSPEQGLLLSPQGPPCPGVPDVGPQQRGQ